MKPKYWLTGWLLLAGVTLSGIAGFVYKVDPYFHYHKPDLQKYFYSLNNQRSQNDGISKHFDYNALITGTSMTENFKTTEFDEIFGVNSIKVSYSGGSYKEMNDNLIIAFKNNPELKTVVRCLDYGRLLDDKDCMRTDLGKYPTYLYDENPFNDVFYLFNKDVIFGRAYQMVLDTKADGFESGITSFDAYSRWQDNYTFGVKTVLPDGVDYKPTNKVVHLTDEDRKNIYENITQNVTSLADEHPEATFYYFFSPYSAAWWIPYLNDGTAYKWFEAEQYAIELILQHKNIKLFSFNNRTDITTDLNNYKDAPHYGEWINSFMLRAMHDGKYILTEDNYKDYLEEEKKFYTTFDYNSLARQEDYECDFYAAALMDEEINGIQAVDLLTDDRCEINLSDAEIIEVGKPILKCKGRIDGNREDYEATRAHLMDDTFVGVSVRVNKMDEFRYLVFNGRKIAGDCWPIVLVYNDHGDVLSELSVEDQEDDGQWHQYLINVEDVKGNVTILFNGGAIDSESNEDPEYQFSDLMLY